MAIGTVFQNNEELRRLEVQSRLLKPYEQPVYQRAVNGRNDLSLLDIGCNNGGKTVDRFTCDGITRVVGLEYHSGLARWAQETYGSNVFSFHPCDVEAPDFSDQLTAIMAHRGIEAFDLIHISYVLLHLKDPGGLLSKLRRFLAPGGRLIVMETNDGISELIPDSLHLFGAFLDILSLDPFAGDRTCGGRVSALLANSGYQKIVEENILIRAGGDEPQKKKDLFDIFFSYLPQDIRLLRRQETDNIRYASCTSWLSQHYNTLRNIILAEESELSIGIRTITCVGDD